MDRKTIGDIRAIALRTAVRGPMREVSVASGRVGRGLEGDVTTNRWRGVTFLAAEQWAEVMRELNVDLPWHTRRANLLVGAASLAPLIGCTVRVGGVRVRIHAETKPCALMDELHAGLRKALSKECRGGVYGELLSDGAIQVGDRVVLED